MTKYICLLLLWGSLPFVSEAQTQQELSSGEIYKKIEKLNFLGNVLYVGAHPDDENTAMISYLSNKTNARVGYLSMNRGDGGQNIIGTEIRELLGVIRTEELLAARRIDGGEQFFTRSNDFGFSKNPTETFKFWDKQKVLSDVVRIFRKFRPDVIIDRFNHRTEGDTHGHHTASALLSVEAFDLAGKKDQFTDQLDQFEPWQPKRLYFNDSCFFYGSKEKYHQADHSSFLTVEQGVYLPVLGKSNSEIASLSRSQHRSQGFGMLIERGSDKSYFEPIKGNLEGAQQGVFTGINTTWSRVKGGKAIGKILYKVQTDFDFTAPEKSIPNLLKAYKLIQNLKDKYWRSLKSKEIEEVITASAGLYLEAFTDQKTGTRGEELPINFEAINRSSAQIELKSIHLKQLDNSEVEVHQELGKNKEYTESIPFTIPENSGYSSPYWLRKTHSLGMYNVENLDLIGLPQTPPQLVAQFDIVIGGVEITVDRELIYKASSQIEGEIKEPFAVVPAASVSMEHKVLVFPDNSSRTLQVEVEAFRDDLKGILSLEVPKEWEITPEKIEVDLTRKQDRKKYKFEITPPKDQSEANVKPRLKVNGGEFTKTLHTIDYSHIPTRYVMLPAQTKLNRIEIKTQGERIAYIKGAGDVVPDGLREIGYQVTELEASDISLEKLRKYDAVILGIRIYNVNEDVIRKQNILFDYVKQGGTLVTQYSQVMGLKTDKIAPYPLKMSSKRVTDEESDIRFLKPEHPVLNSPNKITQQDFEGWVQERGLYFPSEWSKEFTPILGMQDQGEEELQGSLLVAKYGKGHYVYTGLSFFRELPAGVPGAYRLFANILAL